MGNKPFFCFFIIVAMGIALNTAFSKDFAMLHFTERDGLPSNTIYSIYRDSNGFLWIATDRGIARYNGVKFEIFTTFNGLPDNEIFFFHEDHLGRIWMGAYNGELCYYKNDTFHTAKNTGFLKLPFKASFVRQITSEKDSSVNIIYTDNSKFLNIHNERCSIVNLDSITRKKQFGNIIYREKVSEDNYKLTFTDKIVNVIAPYNINNIYSISDNKHKDDLKPICINFFGQNVNYIITYKYIFTPHLDVMRVLYKRKFVYKKALYLIYNDKNDWFYAGSDGLFINDTIHILKKEKVSGITQDIMGNYWASTLDNGIFVVNKNITGKVYRKVYTGNIEYCFSHKNILFFTTKNKNISSIENGKINYLCNYNKFLPSKLEFVANSGFFYIDSSYRFYNCYVNGGIVIDNILSRSIKIKKYYCNLVRTDDINQITGVGNYLYINTRDKVLGIDFNNFQNGSTLSYRIISDSLCADRIFGIAKSLDNTIWYSTIKNIYKVENGRSIAQPRFKNSTFRSFIFCGKHLVGCNHNNMLLIDSNLLTTINFDAATTESCIWEKFYKLDEHHVLVKTNNLYRIITLSDNLPSVLTIENQFVPLQADAICADSSQCYFFKNGSITSFDISSLLVKSDPPKLFFNYLKTNKKSYLAGNNNIQIPFAESKNLKIYFSTLSLGSKDVFYQCSFSKNKQDNWTDVEGGQINLFNPAYGNYVVKIRAKTISSDYCDPIVFTIGILPPYWATWWFILLSVCIIMIILFSIIFITWSLVLRAAKRRNQQLELELKSIYSQINPHFIYNSLNAAMYLVKTNRSEDAFHHIYKFSHLLRAYIKSSRNRFITLSEEIKNLGNYIELQQVRFKDRFDFEIITESSLDTSISIPSLLLQPIVENAITHGLLLKQSKGYLKMSFKRELQGNGIVCIIDDDGIGRERSLLIKNENTLKTESYGGDLVKDLIGILNKYEQIKIDIVYIDKEEPLTGTIVKLTIKNFS